MTLDVHRGARVVALHGQPAGVFHAELLLCRRRGVVGELGSEQEAAGSVEAEQKSLAKVGRVHPGAVEALTDRKYRCAHHGDARVHGVVDVGARTGMDRAIDSVHAGGAIGPIELPTRASRRPH